MPLLKIDFHYFTLILFGGIGVSMIEIYRSYLVTCNQASQAYFIKFILVQLVTFALIYVFWILFKNLYYSILVAVFFAPLIVSIGFLTKKFNLSLKKSLMFKELSPFFLIQFLYFSNTQILKVIQGNVDNLRVLALLSISLILVRVMTMLPMNLSFIFMPSISRLYKQNNISGLQLKFKILSKISASYIIPLVVFSYLFSEKIMSLIGSQFTEGAVIFKILLAYVLMVGLMGPNGPFLLMTKRQKYEVYNGAILIITGVVGGLVFPKLLTSGIAIAFVLAEGIVILNKRRLVKKKFKIRLFSIREWLKIFFGFFASTIAFNFFHDETNIYLWVAYSLISVTSLMILLFSLLTTKSERAMLLKYD